MTVFPASPFHFAIYLRHLMSEVTTASPLKSAVHSISWFHQCWSPLKILSLIFLPLVRILSLRNCGATAAANAGVPGRLFKRHGRWASESAKDGYVQDSLSSRLSVSKALDI